MARKSDKKVRTEVADPPAPGGSSLRLVLILTLATIAVALGLMGWNTHLQQDRQTLQLIQRDALLVGERFNRSATQALESLDRELRSGTRLDRIDRTALGADALMSLSAAENSNEPSVKALADKARELISAGDRMTLLADGRVMLVHVPVTGPGVLMLAEPEQWLSGFTSAERVGIYGASAATFGNRNVLPPNGKILQTGSGFRQDGPTNRSATSCVGLAKAEFSICTSRSSPLLTLDTGIQLLLYFLLLAAPGLAIFGLYSNVQNGESEGRENSVKPNGNAGAAGSIEAATSAGVGFWTFWPDRGEVSVDACAAMILGMDTSGELPASDFMSYVYTGHRDALWGEIANAHQSSTFSMSIATAMSGGETWVEFRGSRSAHDDAQGVCVHGALFDVTETIRAQERRKSAEEKLRNAIESFPCPFALWDKNRRLAFWNKAFGAVFDLEGVLRPGTSHETVMLARSGNVISEKASLDDAGMTILGLRNGDWIKFVERTTPAGGLISFGLDVTNDVKYEEELTRQRKKLRSTVQDLEQSEGHNAELARKYNEEKAKAERSAESKSAFLANMSHELRTPLNAINGFSEILVNEMYGPLGHKRYGEYARDILTSGQHLLDMINDILDIAKIEAGKMTIDPKPIDLVDPVDAAVRMIRRKAEDKGLTLSLQTEDALPEVDADHRAVRQMVLNLLSNAIKFTDAGGRILIAVQRKDGFVRVAVRDTGVGIPKEHIPRLAQPFEQVQETRERNYEGTGLGLALTKSFAEMHGGRFTIASEVGKGTMVSFFLPIHKSAATSDRNVA